MGRIEKQDYDVLSPASEKHVSVNSSHTRGVFCGFGAYWFFYFSWTGRSGP